MPKEKVYQVNGWRLAAILLIILMMVAFLSVFGLYFLWRSEAHLALQEARNVLTAMRMVGLQYYGSEDQMYDFDTRSGLSKAAEQQVRRLTASEGEIMVMESTPDMLEPAKMIYRTGKYLANYYLDDDGERQWEVFRINTMFKLDGSQVRRFE